MPLDLTPLSESTETLTPLEELNNHPIPALYPSPDTFPSSRTFPSLGNEAPGLSLTTLTED